MPTKKTSPKKSAEKRETIEVEGPVEINQVDVAIAENLLAIPMLLNTMARDINKMHETTLSILNRLEQQYRQIYGMTSADEATAVGAAAAKNYFLNEQHETHTTKSAVRRERAERREKERLALEADAAIQEKAKAALNDEETPSAEA